MKRGTPRHPKTSDLADRLTRAGVPAWLKHPCAVGLLESLWHFTAEFAPRGDIGRYSNKRIAAACGWGKNVDIFVQTMVDSIWIDRDEKHRLIVHDWKDHADDAVRKRLTRAGLSFVELTPKVTELQQTMSATLPDSGSLPKPLPEPVPLPEPLESEAKPAPDSSCDFLTPTEGGSKPKRKASPKTVEKRAHQKLQQESWFEEFRELYVWKWEGEDGARKIFAWKVKTEETWTLIRAAVIEQAPEQLARDPQFRTCPTKWLMDGKWKDKPPAPGTAVITSQRHMDGWERKQAETDRAFRELMEAELEKEHHA